MRTVLKGNIIHAPALGQLSVTPGGYLLLEDGAIVHICPTLPDSWKNCPLEDYGDCLILQSFADMHLHAPQYPQLGLGMDLPLLAWLDTYTFPLEAAFADEDFARRAYRALARELIALGTTRVCMFSSVHRRATQILMEELEAAGVTGTAPTASERRRRAPWRRQSAGWTSAIIPISSPSSPPGSLPPAPTS